MTEAAAFERLRVFVEERDYAGYDPYDALKSPLAPLLTGNTKWGRIALTQALRRSPWNPRPLLGIRPGHNAKALALFLEGYCRLHAAGTDCSAQMGRLVGLLAANRSPWARGTAWGYDFAWQSQAFFAPAGTPNAVVSSFAAHALLDAHEAAGWTEALDMALGVRDFLLTGLNRIGDDASFCFSYTPLDRYPVLNAGLLAASVLLRIAVLTDDRTARDAALAVLDFTMRRQNADGSFPYADRDGFRWIDSFHTGFVLESIRRFLDAGEAAEYRAAYERGVHYYAENFFLDDGTPKYYHDRVFPIDIHSPAEAVAFFSAEPRWSGLTASVLDWMLTHRQDPAGWFYFRKGLVHTNRIAYMRWAQAWAFRALACAVARTERRPERAAAAAAVGGER